MEVSNQLFKQLKSRQDEHKALEICEIATDLSMNKFKKGNENPYMFFIGQQVLLYYKLGKNEDAYNLSQKIYDEFSKINGILKVKYLISVAKYLLEVMAQTGNMSIATKLFEDIQDLLAEDNWQSLSPQQIYEIYYLNFGILFLDGRYEEAAEQGWKSYQQLINLTNSNFRPEYILKGIYLCYKKQEDIEKCDTVLKEIQKFQQIDQQQINKLEKSYFQPFKNESLEEKEKKFKNYQHHQHQQKSTQQQEKFVNIKSNWNINNDKGNQFIKNKAFKEGIAYYKEILNQLDKNNDTLKYIFVQDRIAYLYSECKDFKKAIDLCLNSHSMLLNLHKNELVQNDETFQNLSYLKSIYERNCDLDSAIEWGKKWHKYCIKFNLFEIESEVLESNMLTHLDVLNKADKVQDVIDYSKFIITYLQRFNKGKEQFKYGLNQILFSVSSKINNIQGQKDAVITICEISRNLKNKLDEYNKPFLDMLKEASILTLETNDIPNFMKYGQEFIQIQNEFKSEEELLFRSESIDIIQIVIFNLGKLYLDRKEYNQAEDLLQQYIDNSIRSPIDSNQIQAHLLLSSLLIQQSRLEEAQKQINEAIYLHQNYFISETDQLKNEINIIKTECQFYYYQPNYEKLFDKIDLYFKKKNTSSLESLDSEITIIINNLISQEKYQTKTYNLIKKYKLKFNQ